MKSYESIKVLAHMPYAQAHVRMINGDAFLFSYTTLVAELKKDDEGQKWLKVNGLYSMTTRKHISAFLKEYAPTLNFQTAKDAFLNNYVVCADTGEVIRYDEV